MKNFIVRVIWLGSFLDVVKFCFNCFLEFVLIVFFIVIGDSDFRDIIDFCYLLFV